MRPGRVWRCGRFSLPLDRPLVMGVLNVTPDSFSDGGLFADPLAALAHAGRMAEDGADVIDVGGESTRPGAAEVPPAEETARVRPVIGRLAEDLEVPLSVDTRHAECAEACVAAGASVINDVGGFRDAAMVRVAAGCDAGLVVMHMLGEPGTMQDAPAYRDVVAEVCEWLERQAEGLAAAGVERDRICVDPGIGFGKLLEHNLALLRGLPRLASLGYPVAVGVSRKRMIGELTGVDEPGARLAGSLAAAALAVANGADIVRVHDVADSVQALRVAASLGVPR